MLQVVDSSHWAIIANCGYVVEQPYYLSGKPPHSEVVYWVPRGTRQTIGIMTSPRFKNINCDWLKQFGGYNGQHAVRHFKANGLVLPAQMTEFQTVHPDVSIVQEDLGRTNLYGRYISYRTEYRARYTVQVYCRSVQTKRGGPWTPYVGIIVYKCERGKWGTHSFRGRYDLLPHWASPSGDVRTPDVVIHYDRLDDLEIRCNRSVTSQRDVTAHADIESIKGYIGSLGSQLRSAVDDPGNVIRDKLMRECIEDLPVSDETNNIGNAIQIVDALHDLAKFKWSSLLDNVKLFKRKGAAKAAADAWLAWRYSYNTTKSDVESEIKLAKKRVDLALSPGIKKAHASETTSLNFKDTVINVKMTVVGAVTAKSACGDLKKSIYAALDSVGVAPTWSRIWDLLPFSFIVDWALPFSDFAEAVHLNKYCSIDGKDPEYDLPYDVKWVSYSQKATCMISDTTLGMRVSGSLSYYQRAIYKTFVVDSAQSWDGPSKTSAKTWLKRTIDSASLIIGMRRS